MCDVKGCDRARHARGLCRAHYQRLLKYGDPEKGRALNGDQLSWLRAHAKSTADECITWPFYRYKDGYGRVRSDGATRGAHRVMCEIAHGTPSEGYQAAHSCGNGHNGCVNPNHLSWKTAKDNMADAKSHGRLKGSRGRSVKFSEEDVLSIRAARKNRTLKSLAEEYETSAGYISNICNGRYWSHLPMPD